MAGDTESVQRRHVANIVGGALALLACATVCVVAGWTGGRASVELRQRIYVPKNIPKISNMVQFTQAEGEMKAHASMFSTMGRKPAASSRGVWTGHGGSTFARLAKEASSPVAEAEKAYTDSVARHMPHSTLSTDWWDEPSSGPRHSLFRTETPLERMRDQEEKRRHREDRKFFSGVRSAYGDKKGSALMKSFDPSYKGADRQKAAQERASARRAVHAASGDAGVAGDTHKIAALVASLKKAKGDKGVLRRKMQELQSQIKTDFKKVTVFGSSAKTLLEREEAKKKAAARGGGSAARHGRHRGRSGGDRVHRMHLMHIGDPL